jgi:hypothetical protein
MLAGYFQVCPEMNQELNGVVHGAAFGGFPDRHLVVRFTNNVVVFTFFWYRRVRQGTKAASARRPLCVDQDPLLVTFPRNFCKRLGKR